MKPKFIENGQKKNRIFIILDLVPIRCRVLAEPNAATCTKAHKPTLGMNPVSRVKSLVLLTLNYLGG